MKTFAAVVLAIVLTGCRFSSVDYTPGMEQSLDKEQAKAVLYKIVLEQKREFGAKDVLVDDEKISFQEKHSQRTFYYSSITRMQMRKHLRTGLFCIFLYNNKIMIYVIRCYTQTDAERFIDAFVFMQKHNEGKQ